jgi:hypothetical protein
MGAVMAMMFVAYARKRDFKKGKRGSETPLETLMNLDDEKVA